VSRDRQAVVAVLRLVGPQDANCGVEFPGTPQAVVMARIGSSLLYLHEEQTAAHLRRVWEDAWLEAKLLPQLASPKWVAPVTGMREPGVVVHASGRHAASGALVRPREELPPFLRIPGSCRSPRAVRRSPAAGVQPDPLGQNKVMAETRWFDYGFQVLIQDGYWIVRVHDPTVPEEQYEIIADEDADAAVVSLEDFIEQAQEALAELRGMLRRQQP
jgi:hypothetical protein